MSQAHAVIETGGKQYLVKPGATIHVEKLSDDAGATTTFTDKLGGGTVTATVVEHGKDDTIRVVKFHNKTRSYRRQGHRQAFTTLRIDTIS